MDGHDATHWQNELNAALKHRNPCRVIECQNHLAALAAASDSGDAELQEVVKSWPTLDPELRRTVMRIVR